MKVNAFGCEFTVLNGGLATNKSQRRSGGDLRNLRLIGSSMQTGIPSYTCL